MFKKFILNNSTYIKIKLTSSYSNIMIKDNRAYKIALFVTPTYKIKITNKLDFVIEDATTVDLTYKL